MEQHRYIDRICVGAAALAALLALGVLRVCELRLA